MTYTRTKKKDMNAQLVGQLSESILYTSDNVDSEMQKIFLMLNQLPPNCTLVNSVEDLCQFAQVTEDCYINPVVTIFIGVKQLTAKGEESLFLADYVLPRFEEEYAERIVSGKIYIYQPEQRIIYKGRVER